jgi:hypothetical protein
MLVGSGKSAVASVAVASALSFCVLHLSAELTLASPFFFLTFKPLPPFTVPSPVQGHFSVPYICRPPSYDVLNLRQCWTLRVVMCWGVLLVPPLKLLL